MDSITRDTPDAETIEFFVRWIETQAGEGAAEIEGLIATKDVLMRLRDEVTFWRQDAAARLRTAITIAKAAERKDELNEAARIRVSIIMPTRAALASALSGDLYYPLCEGCSAPIKDGDAVYTYEDGELVHVDCAVPQKPDPIPEEARRYAEHSENSPEGIAATLAAARAYLDEEG